MDMNSVPLFAMIAQKMSWLSARQNVLAQNVANANTPGYQARDVKPLDFAAMVAGEDAPKAASMITTNARHIALSVSGTGEYETAEARDTEGSPTGNVVSLEQEMIKLSDTQIQYQTATNIYAKALGMFRTALGSKTN